MLNYRAKNEQRDPVGVLRRRMRKDIGGHPSLSDGVRRALAAQHKEHPGWSAQLHYALGFPASTPDIPSGRVEILRGPAALVGTLYGHEQETEGDFGWALSSGDVNGDGVADLVVGEPGYNPTPDDLGSQTGRAYAVFGPTFVLPE